MLKLKFLSSLASLLLAGNILFAAGPVITSFSPSSGPVGSVITIKGTGFSNVPSLSIGGKAAIVISNTDTQVVGMVMPGAVTGKISVTVGGVTSASSSDFTTTATSYPSTQRGGKLVGSE
ncbi:MAG TPA: IPT/TIG domain-containing protein, partial [Mucilaginibacter sp.]|nr:IPT/TIG domain-containing protein [Mucilaginibacter sp.]